MAQTAGKSLSLRSVQVRMTPVLSVGSGLKIEVFVLQMMWK